MSQRKGPRTSAPDANEYDENEMEEMEDPFGDFSVFKDKRSGITGMGNEGDNIGGFQMGAQRSGHGATGDPRGNPMAGHHQQSRQDYPPQQHGGHYQMPSSGPAYGGRPPAQYPGGGQNYPPPMTRPDVSMSRHQMPPGQLRPGMGTGYGQPIQMPPSQHGGHYQQMPPQHMQMPPQQHGSGWGGQPGYAQHAPPKMPVGRGRPGAYMPKSEYNPGHGYGQPMRY